jgi:hypothetical protein
LRICRSSAAVSQMSSASAIPRIRPRFYNRACWRSALSMKHSVSPSQHQVGNVTNIPAEILHAQASLCNRPHDSYTKAMKITAYVTGIIPVVAVAMRFASRWLGGNPFWWDDWVHLASAVSSQTVNALVPTDNSALQSSCVSHSVLSSNSTSMRESESIHGT